MISNISMIEQEIKVFDQSEYSFNFCKQNIFRCLFNCNIEIENQIKSVVKHLTID